MTGRSLVFFAMDEFGHFQSLLPVLDEVVRQGVPAYVFTHPRYAESVRAAGGRFVDLFESRPLEAADKESRPIPCRYVTFAGRFGAALAETVAALRPMGILYDTFAVVGAVVGRTLGLPYVNVCGGHEIVPSEYLESLSRDPRVSISDDCRRAVDALRSMGFPDASPFSYVTALSPYLNLYGEPPAFLSPAARRSFEPVGFFGALPSPGRMERRPPAAPAFGKGAGTRLYVSFGTVVTRYFREQALAAWRAVADCAEGTGESVVISLAGATLDAPERLSIARPNVAVRTFVDQWSVLSGATLFLTQHGMHSTHEALYLGVPMLSYPFFWDQPALARKCAELGTAVPAGHAQREPLDARRLRAAIDRCLDSLPAMKRSLAAVREWEVSTLSNRESLVRRIRDLCSSGSTAVRS